MLRDVSRCTARPPRRRKDALAPHIESPEVEEADAQQIRTPRSMHNHVVNEAQADPLSEPCGPPVSTRDSTCDPLHSLRHTGDPALPASMGQRETAAGCCQLPAGRMIIPALCNSENPIYVFVLCVQVFLFSLSLIQLALPLL